MRSSVALGHPRIRVLLDTVLVFGGRTPDEVYATQATEEKLAA